MYKIGDKIVYPMHGAGVIDCVETRSILGEEREYYILNVPCGDMKIMIPVDNTNGVGIRNVIERDHVDQVISVLGSPSEAIEGNWNRRYRENMLKLKTGNILSVAEVVKNLVRAERIKTLSTGEKKMLSNAKQILFSELILVTDMNKDEVESLVSATI